MNDETPDAPRVRNGDQENLERRAMRHARKVVDALTTLKLDTALSLPLDDAVARSLREWHAIPGGKGQRAKGRLEDRLMREVRMSNVVELAALLGDGNAVREDPRTRAARAWRDRIQAEGNDAVEAFIEAHPMANRQRIRQYARRVSGEAPTPKALAALLSAIADEMPG